MTAALTEAAGGLSYRTMRGRQKAAAFLVSLGPERAAEIMKFLTEREVESLSAEMAAIWRVEPDDREELYREMYARLAAGQAAAVGGLEYAREVLEHLLGPERAAEIVGSLTVKGELRPFDFLRRTPPERIRAFLQDESPQTIALVLGSVWSGLAGKVLSELPVGMQIDVAHRIASMQETNPSVIADIDRGLRDKAASVSTHEFTTPGGVDSLAQILNYAGRSAERQVLEHLEDSDPQLADQVKLRMFTFENLSELSDRDMQLVLREVDPKDLMLALRGAKPELLEKVLSNMSQRGAEMLREDMEALPPQRRSVVEAAQNTVVGAARRLEEAGALVLRKPDGDGDEVL